MPHSFVPPSPPIFALDLGTTKFCLATLVYPPKGGRARIEKVVVPSGGMRRGMVCHMQEAEKALDHLLSLAEQKFKQDVKKVYLGVAGSHLKGRLARATLDIGGDAITEEDQHAILAKCQQGCDPAYEVLHNIPITFQVDSREFVDCPLGFSGDFLRGESFVIEADKNYLKDLIRLCNGCGLTVQKLYAEPYASAMVTVPYEQKQQGVIVADIGGGTTDGIVFKGGKPIKLFTANVGGQLMTRDLATCLRLSMEDAHQMKHHFGLEHLSQNPSVERITVQQTTGRAVQVSAGHVYMVLSCRIMELFEMILHELGPLKELMSSGMIITGGGSELKNIGPFISKQQALYVSKNKPHLPKMANETPSPHERTTISTPYATVAGLLYLAWLHEQKNVVAIKSKATLQIRSFWTWIKEIA